jgi:prepilin-type N-terminal cleavage/methylation domain-containing protein
MRPPAVHARDEGLTLVELLVALMLLLIVSAVFLPTLTSSLFATRDLQNVARSNDAGRLALADLDREFRAAERICVPNPGSTGDTLSFRTRAWTATTTASGYQDLIYQLNGTDLERSGDGGTSWAAVVGDVVNATVVDDDYNAAEGRPLGTVGVPLFSVEGGSGSFTPSEGKVVTVRVWVDSNPGDRVSPKLLTTELSGRNIWIPNSAGC